MSLEQPPLPEARGSSSRALIEYLDGRGPAPETDVIEGATPDDLQLALYVSYGLHYRSFAGVDDGMEWDPAALAFRGALERCFEETAIAGIEAPVCPPEAVGETLFRMAEEDDGPSLARRLEASGTVEQFREFMIHRSAYQLKEADPHTWAIPRVHGAAKSALVEVQTDEYGSGDPERMHSKLFANSMEALGLDSRYGAYIDLLPAATLATVNLISFFALKRGRRGALVGHLAMFEITSAVPNRRYAAALRRLGFGKAATDFYDEHVEADSVHENVAAYDLAQGLAVAEPELTGDILFGARALLALDADMAAAMIAAWDAGASSLRGARGRALAA